MKNKLKRIICLILVTALMCSSSGVYTLADAMEKKRENGQMKKIGSIGTEIEPIYDEDTNEFIYTVPAGGAVYIENLSEEERTTIRAVDTDEASGDSVPFYAVEYSSEGSVDSYDRGSVWWLHTEAALYVTYNDKNTHKISVSKEDASYTKVYQYDGSLLEFKEIQEGKNYDIKNGSQKEAHAKFSVDYYHYETDENGNRKNIINMVQYASDTSCSDMDFYADRISLDKKEEAIISVKKLENKEAYLYYPVDDQTMDLTVEETKEQAFSSIKFESSKIYRISNPKLCDLIFCQQEYNYNEELFSVNALGYDSQGGVDYVREDFGLNGYIWHPGTLEELDLDIKQAEEGKVLYYPSRYADLSLKIEETKDPLWYEKEITDKTMLKLTNVSSQYRNNIKIDCSEETKVQMLEIWGGNGGSSIEDKQGKINYFLGQDRISYIRCATTGSAITVKIPNKYIADKGVIVTEKEGDFSSLQTYDLQYDFKFTHYFPVYDDIEDESTVTAEQGDISAYHISIKNITTGEPVYEYLVDKENNRICFAKEALKQGDKLQIQFKHYCGTTGQIEVTIGDSGTACNVTTYERGCLDVIVNTDNLSERNDKVILYDEKGNLVWDDEQSYHRTAEIAFWQTNWNGHFSLEKLNQGKYTVVYLKANGDDWEINSLDQYRAIGAVEGVDYLMEQFEVKNCEKTRVDFSEKKLSYTGVFDYLKGSNLYVNKENAAINKLIMVTLEYNLNDKRLHSLGDATIEMNVSNSLQIQDGSLVVDGEQTNNYKISSDKQTVQIRPEKLSGKINLYVVPTKYDDDAEINAKLKVENAGYQTEASQEIGRVKVKIPQLTINAPSVSVKDKIDVWGITSPENEVTIYLDGEAVKTTKAKKDGTYSTNIDLKKVGNHEVYAENKINGNTIKSDIVKVNYNKGAVAAISNEFYYSDNDAIDLADSNCQQAVLTFRPREKYHYELDLANDDDVAKVLIGSLRDGVMSYIPAEKDTKTGKWITEDYFNDDPEYVPGQISMKYFTNEQIYLDSDGDGECMDEILNFQSLVKEHFGDGLTVEDVEKKETANSSEYHAKYKFNKDKSEIAKKYKKDIKIEYKQKATKKEMSASQLKRAGFQKINRKSDTYIKYSFDNGYLKLLAYYEGKLHEFVSRIKAGSDIIDTVSGISKIWKEICKCEKAMKLPPELEFFKTMLDVMDRALNVGESGLSDAQQDKLLRANVLAVLGAVAISMAFSNPLLAFVGPLLAGVLLDWYVSNYQTHLEEGGIGGPLEYFFSFLWLVDPSGYVYDEKSKKRLKDVKATLYYKDESGNAVKWNAEDYSQRNSQYTDSAGNYAWDVPKGLWKVTFEKEGYQTTETEWLLVPPPQVNINVAMTAEQKDLPMNTNTPNAPQTMLPVDNAGALPANTFSPSNNKNTVSTKKTKKKQHMVVKKTKIVKYRALKKKKVTFSLNTKVSGGAKVTYRVVKGKKKFITVKKSGLVVLKKGCKKGKYIIKIYAAATKEYFPAKQSVTVKVK